MYLKCALFTVALALSWALLVFGSLPTWGMILSILIVGLSVAGIGFNVMHDGGHKSFSKHPWVNKLMAYSSDLVGASSYFWNVKHNHLHHTYVNIHGHDNDIDLGVLGRFSPEQPRLSHHRFQHLYMWFLYLFTTIKWNLYDDYQCLLNAQFGHHAIKRPTGYDRPAFWFGKFFFYSWAFVIPCLFHSVGVVLAVYFVASAVSGLTLALVFQLAHVLEEAEFPTPNQAANRLDTEWSVHQIQTTINFSQANPVLSWFVGGLNFQIEHHLFPKISHVHYPALSPIVQQTCIEYGVSYSSHASVFQGLRSHYRHLKRLGKPINHVMKNAA